MTDSELLTYSAKAAGRSLIQGSQVVERGLFTTLGWWNPLTDNRDALWLALKLGLQISQDGAALDDLLVVAIHAHFPVMPDPYAATRRAIVRVAAEIGAGLRPFPSAEEIHQFAGTEPSPQTPD